MVKKPAFLALMLVAAMAGSATSALAAAGSVRRPSVKGPTINRHISQLSASTGVLNLAGARLFDIIRAMGRFGILELPDLGTVYQTDGINDGPDGCDPLGVKESRPRTDSPPLPAGTPAP